MGYELFSSRGAPYASLPARYVRSALSILSYIGVYL